MDTTEPTSPTATDPAELEAIRARIKEMEADAEKLREMQAKLETTATEAQDDADARSIHVGNVDYGSTPEELIAHFQSCGAINRVTIPHDKFTGQAKGFAYVEFADASSVANAMVLNESLFRGRMLQISAKRTNIPGFNRRGRGRGGYRARGRGAFRGRAGYRGRRGGFTPY
jgi:polyadenylate-binding protein 2